MKSNQSYTANGSEIYFSETADLEEPFDQIVADLNRGVARDLPDKTYVVSGSAVLRLFIRHVRGETPEFEKTDTDVYAESADKYRDLVTAFTRETDAVYKDHSSRSVTLRLDEEDYDFVCWRYGGLFDIISTHDLSTCGIGVAVNDGSARLLAITKEFVRTMSDGRLRAQNDFKESDPVSMARTIDRMFKYKSRGFHPTFELLNDIAQRIYSRDPDDVGVSDAPTVAEEVANATQSDASA